MTTAKPLTNRDVERLMHAGLNACRAAGVIQRKYFRSDALQVETKADATPVTQADRGSEQAIREVLRTATPEFGLLGEEFGAEGNERDRWVIDPIDGTKNFVAGLPYFAVLLGLMLDGEVAFGMVHAPAMGLTRQPSSSADADADAGETWWAAHGGGAFMLTGTRAARAITHRMHASKVADPAQAFVIHGGLAHFRKRGLWPGFERVVDTVYRTRGFGDWWGHMLVAEGRADAMIDPVVALHDIAAVKIVVEEASGHFIREKDAPLTADFKAGAISCAPGLSEAMRGMMGF